MAHHRRLVLVIVVAVRRYGQVTNTFSDILPWILSKPLYIAKLPVGLGHHGRHMIIYAEHETLPHLIRDIPLSLHNPHPHGRPEASWPSGKL